jgi:hypothetical protein
MKTNPFLPLQILSANHKATKTGKLKALIQGMNLYPAPRMVTMCFG